MTAISYRLAEPHEAMLVVPGEITSLPLRRNERAVRFGAHTHRKCGYVGSESRGG